MTSLIKNFVKRVDFDSYEDFYNNFEFVVPENFNFGFDVIDEYARIDPDKKALIWCDDNQEIIFTFNDIKKLSNQAANFFKSQGIGVGDTVLLTLKNRYEFWICMVALHKLNAIAIPATHMLKTHDILYRLEKADVKMVVSIDEDTLLENYEECAEELGIDLKKAVVAGFQRDGWFDFDSEIAKMSDVFERVENKHDDTSLVYFSSGTSGEPKMIEHAHDYALGHMITAYYWQCVIEDGIHHTAADSGWGKAVWGNLYGQWISGTAIFIYDYVRFNGLDLIQKLVDYKVTTFCAPPTILKFLIKEELDKFDLSNIKHIATAGENLPPEVFNRFKELTGLEIKEGFGQTETTVSIATFKWLASKPGSVGKPSPAFNIKLVDNDEDPVDIGDEGQIVFDLSEGRPVGLFKSYYNMEEANKEAFHHNSYHCGDQAYCDEDGYYHFVGRNDDVIKSSGYRIGPYEVESALISHPAVLECAVTAYPDDTRVEIVKATIVLTKEYEPSDELTKEIQNHVKRATAPYKYPRMVVYADELPKSSSGKIQRKVIRERDLIELGLLD